MYKLIEHRLIPVVLKQYGQIVYDAEGNLYITLINKLGDYWYKPIAPSELNEEYQNVRDLTAIQYQLFYKLSKYAIKKKREKYDYTT